MTEKPPEGAAQRKRRSPSYPAIDIGLALERAEQLWKHEHHYRTAVPTALGHWGYGAKSGGGLAALAALKSFGLLLDEGAGDGRRVWLSDLAQEIIAAESEEDRRRLIQRAALTPRIHRELWEQYGPRLPSDQTLNLFLLRERNFTPNGARELISEWKRTMARAGLTGNGATVPHSDESARDETPGRDDGEPGMTPPPTLEQDEQRDEREQLRQDDGAKLERSQRTIQVPYSPTSWALVQASFPMPEREWDAMLAVLQAMKPGLVAPSD